MKCFYWLKDQNDRNAIEHFSGGSRRGAWEACLSPPPPQPLLLDQNEAWRAEKKYIFETWPPSFVGGWMTGPPAYLKFWIRHWTSKKASKNQSTLLTMAILSILQVRIFCPFPLEHPFCKKNRRLVMVYTSPQRMLPLWQCSQDGFQLYIWVNW